MTVYCSLGHINPDGSAFCDTCGEPLVKAASRGQTCRACGAINPVHQAFCSNCGVVLSTAQVLIPPLSQSSPPKQAAIPRPTLRIFISHSHEDNQFGIKLAQDLRRAMGSDSAVWYDASRGLSGGDPWWRKILEELKTRNVFIVVLSPYAMDSPWVNDEIDTAWRLKNSPTRMRIIPVLYQPCEVRIDLSNLQIISFVKPKMYQAAFEELLQAFHQSPIG